MNMYCHSTISNEKGRRLTIMSTSPNPDWDAHNELQIFEKRIELCSIFKKWHTLTPESVFYPSMDWLELCKRSGPMCWIYITTRSAKTDMLLKKANVRLMRLFRVWQSSSKTLILWEKETSMASIKLRRLYSKFRRQKMGYVAEIDNEKNNAHDM